MSSAYSDKSWESNNRCKFFKSSWAASRVFRVHSESDFFFFNSKLNKTGVSDSNTALTSWTLMCAQFGDGVIDFLRVKGHVDVPQGDVMLTHGREVSWPLEGRQSQENAPLPPHLQKLNSKTANGSLSLSEQGRRPNLF